MRFWGSLFAVPVLVSAGCSQACPSVSQCCPAGVAGRDEFVGPSDWAGREGSYTRPQFKAGYSAVEAHLFGDSCPWTVRRSPAVGPQRLLPRTTQILRLPGCPVSRRRWRERDEDRTTMSGRRYQGTPAGFCSHRGPAEIEPARVQPARSGKYSNQRGKTIGHESITELFEEMFAGAVGRRSRCGH